MYTRKNISFNADNIILRGWFYTPQQANKPAPNKSALPCIIMTHGFSALKEHDLDKFAAYFAQSGKCVLIYDNRNFGESAGVPRLEVDPTAQISDLQHAITYVQQLKEVNANKIGLWGTSFSAGVHMVVAAIDKRVKCLVVQVPFVCGHHQFLNEKQYAAIQIKYQRDELSRLKGHPPMMMRVVTNNPEEKAILKGMDAFNYFTRVPSWPNQVTLRSLQYSGDFEPIAYVESVSPTPILFIVASNDTINVTDLALQAYRKAKEPKKLLIIDGDHFDPYTKQFDRCVKSACEWFDIYLN